MENYKVRATENTPEIDLNHTTHSLMFSGDSRPEDVQKFYTPVMKWLDEYSNYLYFLKDKSSSPIEIKCEFKFEYFNSSSAKYVMDIINKLAEIENIGNNIGLKVNWYYEEMDEDMLEAGQEFESMVNAEFNYIITG